MSVAAPNAGQRLLTIDPYTFAMSPEVDHFFRFQQKPLPVTVVSFPFHLRAPRCATVARTLLPRSFDRAADVRKRTLTVGSVRGTIRRPYARAVTARTVLFLRTRPAQAARRTRVSRFFCGRGLAGGRSTRLPWIVLACGRNLPSERRERFCSALPSMPSRRSRPSKGCSRWPDRTARVGT